LVYQHILTMITSRQLSPGGRLDEQSLAQALGVSRTPIREAIGRLAEKGLVEYRPYQGNFVRTFSTQEVSDIYKVRSALEELAIRQTTAAMTPERLEEIRQILDDISEAMERGDVAAVNEADNRFHSTIVRFSGNATLIAYLDDLGQRVQLIRSIANENPEVVTRTALQRPQILAALESGDADLAARLLTEHIEFVRQAVVAEKEADAGAQEVAGE
jgi:DNA-binding GntR family transcriptional regulator